jgi:hypothetical protein
MRKGRIRVHTFFDLILLKPYPGFARLFSEKFGRGSGLK